MKALYEAVVTSEGGRNGHVKSSDGFVDLKVAVPKEMGGAGNASNPEQLFAAGYAACFESALQHVAQQRKKPLNSSKVIAKVQIGPNTTGGFQLAVLLEVYLPGYGMDEGKILMELAHKVCPYSNATRNNIDVGLTLVEA